MKLLGIAVLLFSTVTTSCHCKGCLDFVFSNNAVYASCTVLPVLSSVLHWNYHPANHTADIAFRHGGVTYSDWVAWGLNVDGSGMIGAQAMVAFLNSTGGDVTAYTTPVSWFNTRLRPGQLSFRVPKISANFSGGQAVIFATLELPAGRTRFNHVWQDGYVAWSAPRMHAMYGDNLRSTGSVDFASSGESNPAGDIDGGPSDPRLRRKQVHGILNGLSWGVMMPIGAMSARYVRVFKSIDPAWFYLHVGIQTTAYLIGVAGWITGLKLGHDSPGITHRQHRNIGITLFCLGTLQVLALIFRPKAEHKYRFYWNVYHHTIGYTTILLSILNVFEGLHILEGPKAAYTVVIIVLLAVAVTMEGVTWRIVLSRRSSDSDDETNQPQADNNNNIGHAA